MRELQYRWQLLDYTLKKRLGVEINGSSVSTWKSKYLTEMKHKSMARSMPMKKIGSPFEADDKSKAIFVLCDACPKEERKALMIGEKLDDEVKSYNY